MTFSPIFQAESNLLKLHFFFNLRFVEEINCLLLRLARTHKKSQLVKSRSSQTVYLTRRNAAVVFNAHYFNILKFKNFHSRNIKQVKVIFQFLKSSTESTRRDRKFTFCSKLYFIMLHKCELLELRLMFQNPFP